MERTEGACYWTGMKGVLGGGGGASFRTGTDQLKKDIGVPRPQFSKWVEETNVPFFLCP